MDDRPARRLRYCVAASLDGFIAGPNGEADWIPMDPDIDFGALWAQFDTLLIGRRTWEGMQAMGGGGGGAGIATYVVSTTLRPPAGKKKGPTIIADNVAGAVRALKARPGKDIWLFGGGGLFRSLAELGLVDTVEVAVVPILLGGGVPLRPSPSSRLALTLTSHRVYPKSGIVMLEYGVPDRI